MSRIGNKPISLPQGVKVSIETGKISVEGPKGKLSESYKPLVKIAEKDKTIVISRESQEKNVIAAHGLYRNLIANMVIGVSTGFKRSLIITGVGYKAELRGKIIVLSLGYSSDFFVALPEGIKASIENNGQKIILEGHDKALLGKFASEIRSLRSPEPYKGKGIRYEEEKVRKKVGKTGVK